MLDEQDMIGIVRHCAGLNGKCNKRCYLCSYNLDQYGLTDVQKNMIYAKAQMQVEDEIKYYKKSMFEFLLSILFWLFWIGICIGIPALLFMECRNAMRGTNQQTVAVPKDTIAQVLKGSCYHILSKEVQKRIHDVVAWPDGEENVIDCVDYAVLFYIYSGQKARIIRNDNPRTGMNHLFNYFEGEYIEPQSAMTMEAFWGKKYDPAYNEDVTYMFTVIEESEY